MIRILAVAIAVVAFSFMTDLSAQAQTYAGGYQFGAGLDQINCGLGVRNYTPREQLPYFAKYPPVYYSHIVKRPYGISPYAAPAGIAPVELSAPAPAPVSIKNPFFGKELSPAKVDVKESEVKINKSTMIINPYVESLVIK